MIKSSQSVRVSAPGKMMISGEYAVLGGAEAVVAAVDRRAFASLGAAVGRTTSPEVLAAFKTAQAQVGSLEGDVHLDVSSMRQGAMKIGLGSSAAGAAAAAGLAFAQYGHDLANPATRHEVLQSALRGHQSVAPKGSGADVAASVLGGFIRFRRLGDTVEAHPLEWPESAVIRVVWTGQEARTSDFVARVEALAEQAPATFRRAFSALGRESDAFVSAALAKDVSALVEGTAAYGAAMNELGQAAGAHIMTDSLAEVARLARLAGGAAKPSGAGGGDVALGIFPDPSAAERFERLCAAAGLQLLSVHVGAPGVRLEAPFEPSKAAP